jgi:hypothetical protein
MPTLAGQVFDIADLERVLRAVDPAVHLAPPRVLRRVIRHHRDLGGVTLLVPHRKTYGISRDDFLAIAHPGDVGAAADDLPARLILLVRPDQDQLARLTVEQALAKYWRFLFHARIDQAMHDAIRQGSLTLAKVRARIAAIGITEFEEAAQILREEDYLLDDQNLSAVYAEFVAVYSTTRRFFASQTSHYFPCLQSLEQIDRIVAEDLDVEAIFHATRLPGAPDPSKLDTLRVDGPCDDESARETVVAPGPPPPPAGQVDRLLAAAAAMEKRGNMVRAAILRTRASAGTDLPPAGEPETLHGLCLRLQTALELADPEREEWRAALAPLLARAARGVWTQEARLLYDLQTACLVTERGTYAVDLIDYAISLGRRPLKRPLPANQKVAVVRHLRRAADRAVRVKISDSDRLRLASLLHGALEKSEHRLRALFRGPLRDAMHAVDLKPQNVPEELARNKLVDELLDRIAENGHFNMGNLRDALSRNQIKLADLSGPVELVSGDPLIRLNRQLGSELDGVYRKGEVYMRFLHRVSSVAFGTALGRLLMLYLILPFGLAYFLVLTPELLAEEVTKLGGRIGRGLGVLEKRHEFTSVPEEMREHMTPKERRAQDIAVLVTDMIGVSMAPMAPGPLNAAESAFPNRYHVHEGLPTPDIWIVLSLGTFFLMLFHVAEFRSTFFTQVTRVQRGLLTVFIYGPIWLLHLPFLRQLFYNRYWRLFRRVFLWPVALACAVGILAWQQDASPEILALAVVASLASCGLLLNSRVGNDLEEELTDACVRSWLKFTTDFIPGLGRIIMAASRAALEGVEHVLYTVDEWLRFQTGQSRMLLAFKALAGVVWFLLTYVVRIYINLLAEPTLNPIKHFPVVTIGHKIMLPYLWDLYMFLKKPVQFLGPIFGTGFVVVTIFFLPGICGFVVWELQANWRLYRANRGKNLRPLMIGSHGETMVRLLKPGFHSGTAPKLFRKLRRAARHGAGGTTRKLVARLHHVEESVGQFIERELLALLDQSRLWQGLEIKVAGVRAATNRIAIALACPSLGEQPLVLVFDLQHGWLIGGIRRTAWLVSLSRTQYETLASALMGLYKMAGVHTTWEQLSAALGQRAATIRCEEHAIVVWPGEQFDTEVTYDFEAGPIVQPQVDGGSGLVHLAALNVNDVLLTNVQVSRDEWARTWAQDQGTENGQRHETTYRVLPPYAFLAHSASPAI